MFQFIMSIVQLIGTAIVFFCAGFVSKCAMDMKRMREELREMRKRQWDEIIARNGL